MPVPRNEHHTPEPDSRSGRGNDSRATGQLILPDPGGAADLLWTGRPLHGREADIGVWAVPRPLPATGRLPASARVFRRPWAVPRSLPNGPLGRCANNTPMTRSPGAAASRPRIPPKRQPADLPANLLQVRASSPSDPVSPDGQWPKAIRNAASPMNSNSGSGNNAEAPSCIRPPRPAISRLDDLHCSSSLDCYG